MHQVVVVRNGMIKNKVSADMRIRLWYFILGLYMLSLSPALFAANDSTVVTPPPTLTKRKICHATVFNSISVNSTTQSADQAVPTCIKWAPGNNGSNAFFIHTVFTGGPLAPSGGGNLNAICPTDHPYVTSYVERWTSFNILLGGNIRVGIVDDSVVCCNTPIQNYANIAFWDNADANDKCPGTGI
jgi:hypothetical protein